MNIKPGLTSDIQSQFNENYCELNNIKDPYCPGFVFTATGINNGLNIKAESKKYLKKDFELVTNGTIEFEITINKLTDKEEFSYTVGDYHETFSNISSNQNKIIKQDLKEGNYELVFFYSTTENISAGNNINIKYIRIISISEGVISKCVECPAGYTLTEPKLKCVKCDFGQTLIDNKCVDITPDKCPDFTTKVDKSCSLNEVIHNKEYHIRYNLIDLKQNVETHCNLSNELCDGKFFGPIKDKKTNNIFFISFASKEIINLPDFTFTKDSDFIEAGHIFMLKNNKNSKLLENVGRQIEYVKILPFANGNQNFNQTGLLISYNEGEICDPKTETRYKTYLLIHCAKNNHNDIPRLYMQSGCTFIFEWDTYQVCPYCIKNNTKPLYVI
jgi:hypothetical protein